MLEAYLIANETIRTPFRTRLPRAPVRAHCSIAPCTSKQAYLRQNVTLADVKKMTSKDLFF